jgi:hypothetical protein
MLAPVLDSMMRFCEGALGRGLRIGDRNRLSDDERLLVGLLDGSRAWHVTSGRTDGMEIAFDRTIRSVRIMIAGVMPERIEAI